MQTPGAASEVDELLERDEEHREKFFDELKQKVRAESRDVGTLRKELQVTVPDELIHNRLDKDYDEIRSDVVLPGFRKGRAPLALVQKRFGSSVRDSVKTNILGQSFYAACQNEKLEVLGDPLFKVETPKGVKLMDLGEALPHIHLPDKGDFTFVCEIEVKPTFELPKLEGIEIKAPDVEVTDEMARKEIERQCRIRGRYEPVTDAAADAEDMLVADVTLRSGDEVVKTESNLQLGVRPARLDGIQLEKLTDVLKGARSGESRSIDCVIPDDYERPDLRGKPGRFEFKIHEIKRTRPITVAALLEATGYESEPELMKYIRSELEAERDRLIRRAEKAQVCDYLLKNTVLDLPENVSARMTDRAVMRRVVDLQQQGVPQDAIEAQIDDLRTGARDEATRDLKLEFIFEKIAQKMRVFVTDEEVNSEIARIARLYNQRFDRVRDELRTRGLLPQLVEAIRQEKCTAALLESAQVIRVGATPESPSA